MRYAALLPPSMEGDEPAIRSELGRRVLAYGYKLTDGPIDTELQTSADGVSVLRAECSAVDYSWTFG